MFSNWRQEVHLRFVSRLRKNSSDWYSSITQKLEIKLYCIYGIVRFEIPPSSHHAPSPALGTATSLLLLVVFLQAPKNHLDCMDINVGLQERGKTSSEEGAREKPGLFLSKAVYCLIIKSKIKYTAYIWLDAWTAWISVLQFKNCSCVVNANQLWPGKIYHLSYASQYKSWLTHLLIHNLFPLPHPSSLLGMFQL